MPRLSWNEIAARAAKFADDWAGETYEKGESQSFWTGLLEVFGVDRRRAGGYFEYAVKLANKKYGFIDMFLPGKLLVEQKSAGRDLGAAQGQALGCLDGIPDYDLPLAIVASDFQSFQFLDLETRKITSFPLSELAQNVRLFGFLVDEPIRVVAEQSPVCRDAAERMARLHQAIYHSGYVGHRLELFLVRLIFCHFADDALIFAPGAFENYIRNHTSPDGSDVGPRIAKLFEVLNTPLAERSNTLDEDLQAFPYINGGMFAETIPMPDFNAGMRHQLLLTTKPDWSKVSPAIFGSMFQGVMNEEARHDVGAHYTSEENILRVIKPLFLDDLYAEFEAIPSNRARPQMLAKFHNKLAGLGFLDPAFMRKSNVSRDTLCVGLICATERSDAESPQSVDGKWYIFWYEFHATAGQRSCPRRPRRHVRDRFRRCGRRGTRRLRRVSFLEAGLVPRVHAEVHGELPSRADMGSRDKGGRTTGECSHPRP